ncbi:MAG: hypothetical protein HFH41_04165 [Lachnospiraceae bacterium]|nr:hypothetical protein [Lachnospiraceae bacterium]
MTIKSWFLNRNFAQNERMIIEAADMGEELEVLKETEKAFFLQATSDWGSLKFWCPKSCFVENETEEERQWRIESVARFESNLNYNAVLVKFGKENGIKGIRNGLKTTTLIRKITDAGFEVPARI